MATADDGLELVHPATRAEWRAWLEANHATAPGAWFVAWRPATGRERVPYADGVEEALCFGWIDSVVRTLDDERSAQRYTPRRRGSGWSRSNKERVARLAAAGLLAPAGIAVIEAAEADGSWTLLDDVEDLVVPDDLAAALDARPGARAAWDAVAPSIRKQALAWIGQAKRPDTRARRVALAADRARAGERLV